MTPAARVQTAIDLLDQILTGAPAERVLTTWARKSRFAGSKDRAAIRDHVYDVLRTQNTCAHLGQGRTGRALMIGLLRQQGVDLQTIFTGSTYAPEALVDEETTDTPAAETLDLQDWVIPKLQTQFGAEFAAIERAMKTRAPVIVRVNLRKADRSSALKALEEEGILGEVHTASDTALVITQGARKISHSEAFKAGLVELQDAASQAAIDLLPLDKCAKVLDYCAGGGGKLLAMAAQSDASFFAHDAIEKRLRDLPKRAERAGISANIVPTQDLAASDPFDLVFCDVPCSGSGTWRRDPQGKWALTPEDLDALISLQQDILSDAAGLVQDGGYLAFATCSYFSDENEDQVQWFLQNHSDMTLEHSKRWSHLDDCDGFFTALFRKN